MKRVFAILFCLIFLATLFIVPAHAKIKGEGLTISPPLKEMTLRRGETHQGKIKVTNPTKKMMEVYPLVMNFRALGETGEPTFYSATEEETNFSLAHWIGFSQARLALTSEQVIEFDYQIKVPDNAEPGGHYGVVFFATEPPEIGTEANKVALASMVGSLMLVRVPGKIVEKGAIEGFSTKKFHFSPPVDFATRIGNSGNVHFKPWGEITLKDSWGNELTRLPFNETKGNVLPESIRKFENNWDGGGKIRIGRFTADLRVVYGSKDKTLNDQFIFWIIPWWLIAAVAGVIVIIALWIIIRRAKKRKKQKGKVAKVEQE
jgi:hypothetical protein